MSLPDIPSKDNNPPCHQFFENQLISYKQAAQYLSVCESYLRRLKTRNLIPFVLVGDRAVRFRVSSLNQWVEEREVK
ncbi:MAG: hypothetical protein A2Z97_04220 [Bdellovibrionales bacterium GWB1_52_6]|nr:MAG: hypothetical protein A2Z97_04220 [Bdellovibrionales bacterium GWB1_52_6]OFZ02441.1 MAG: hypothetical protein A2X97_12895 [Bdellovibrionales bacterium GWA1_52_35]HCM41531.1 DNA-binding protein [Bdellovibrionales bacterium]